MDDKTKNKNLIKPTAKQKLKEIWVLFITFFKIGIVCFGGGYAMIALIEREVVEKRNWVTSEEMMNMIAIAESTPGPISINTSTFVGTKRAGLFGAIASTFGVVLPSFLIIFAISFALNSFKSNVWIGYAFKGVRVAVIVLILNAVLKMFKKMEKTVFAFGVLFFTLAMCIFTSISVIYTLLICAAAGIIYAFITKYIKNKKLPPRDGGGLGNNFDDTDITVSEQVSLPQTELEQVPSQKQNVEEDGAL